MPMFDGYFDFTFEIDWVFEMKNVGSLVTLSPRHNTISGVAIVYPLID